MDLDPDLEPAVAPAATTPVLIMFPVMRVFKPIENLQSSLNLYEKPLYV
jgi:hypothetical protein